MRFNTTTKKSWKISLSNKILYLDTIKCYASDKDYFEKLKELIKKFELKDERAITFDHPKMKTKWILPLPGITVYFFEQFQPFFIYFDKEGISFFPLDMNNKYSIIGKSFISWNDLKGFNFKKGLIIEDEIQLQLENEKIKMKIPKSKAMNDWVKINNAYLIEHNHFYNKQYKY